MTMTGLRAAILVAVACLLSGCMGAFHGTTSLATIAPLAQPLLNGTYTGGENSSSFVLEVQKDGTYQVKGDADGALGAFPMFIYGPVAGYYVGEVKGQDLAGPKEERPIDPEARVYFVMRVDDRREFWIATDEINTLMGQILFDAQGFPRPSELDVDSLTSNATLNWLLLQDLIVRHRTELDFELFARRLAD